MWYTRELKIEKFYIFSLIILILILHTYTSTNLVYIFNYKMIKFSFGRRRWFCNNFWFIILRYFNIIMMSLCCCHSKQFSCFGIGLTNTLEFDNCWTCIVAAVEKSCDFSMIPSSLFTKNTPIHQEVSVMVNKQWKSTNPGRKKTKKRIFLQWNS